MKLTTTSKTIIKGFAAIFLLALAVFHGANLLPSRPDGRSLSVRGTDVRQSDASSQRKLTFVVPWLTPSPVTIPEASSPPPPPPAPERAEPSPTPRSDPTCTVFLTSDVYDGDLGGMKGADEKCNRLAAKAGLVRQGREFRAIIFSDEETNPDYDPKLLFSDCSGGFYLPNGKKVANNKKDLFDPDSKLDNPIDYFEDGSKRTGTRNVWTGAFKKNGKYMAAYEDCYQDWSSTKNDKEGMGGQSSSRGREWLSYGLSDCTKKRRLYCAEQEYKPKCRIFVSSQTYTGNLGGLDGANDKCQSLASGAGLTSSGNFKAILFSKSEGVPDLEDCSGGYYVVDTNGDLRKKVADSTKDLLNPGTKLDTQIEYFENGMKRQSGTSAVWTGANEEDDEFEKDKKDCSGWTSSSSNKTGRRGKLTDDDEGWLDNGRSSCDNEYRIYCAELLF